MKKLLAIAILCFGYAVAYSQDFVVVGTPSKLYDQPNMKGTVTLNRDEAEVEVATGMAFHKTAANAGWTTIEYVTGMRSFIPDNVLTDNCTLPEPGAYIPVNDPATKVAVTTDGKSWTLVSNGETYNGMAHGPVVVFGDKFKHQAFTLTKVDGKTMLYTYNNDITHFF